MNWFFYVKALFDPRYELILPAFIYLIGLFILFFFCYSITIYTVQLGALTEKSGSSFHLCQVKTLKILIRTKQFSHYILKYICTFGPC